MKQKIQWSVGVVVALSLLCPRPSEAYSGAKAIFDSGEGPSTSVSVSTPKPSSPAVRPEPTQPYVGISYELMLVSDDGQFRRVSKNRVFRSGERLKMIVTTNRPGYMTVMNVGPTGNTHVLFNEYVDARQMIEVPRSTTLRFVGAPGTEKLLVMLSDNPNRIGGQTMNAGAPPPSQSPYTPTSTPTYGSPQPPSRPYDTASLPPPPPPPTLIASIEGAKGSKDIIVDDNMQSSLSVISPKDGWKPASKGAKDIVLESNNGSHYGVVPVSALSSGGILTLEVRLAHR